MERDRAIKQGGEGTIKETIKQREVGACDSSTCSLFPNSITPLLLLGLEIVFGLRTRRTRRLCVSVFVG